MLEILKFELKRAENVMKEWIAFIEWIAFKANEAAETKRFLSVFCETQLPPQRLWSNKLQGGEVSVLTNQYNHAVEVYIEMNCASLGEFHDVYLATGVLLLASEFEAFREVCYQTCELDCACCFTASNLSGDALLKVFNADLKLLTEMEHSDMVQKIVRLGMSSMYTRRFFKTNNKYLEDYKPEEPSSYLLSIYANNLYGGIMKHCPLPMNDFSIVEESFEDILKTEDNSERGCILELNLSLPEELHDYFADYSLPPHVKLSAWIK